MTEHNICFYQALMADLRSAIAADGAQDLR